MYGLDYKIEDLSNIDAEPVSVPKGFRLRY